MMKIVGHKRVNVYCDSMEYKKILFQSKNITLVDAPYQADIIVQSKDGSHFNNNLIVFTTKYRILKEHKNIIGAFYWSKGRPQIVFIRRRVDAHKLHLDNDLKKYLVEEL